MRKTCEEEVVYGMKIQKNVKQEICKICIKGKQVQRPFQNSERESGQLRLIVHNEMRSPIRTASIGNSNRNQVALSIDHFSLYYFRDDILHMPRNLLLLMQLRLIISNQITLKNT